MSRIRAFLAATLLLNVAVAAAENQSNPATDLAGNAYVGTLGTQKIGLSVSEVRGNHLRGHYFYWKFLKDIPLTGTIVGPRDILLEETNESGSKRGAFTLHLSETDPDFKAEVLTVDRIVGKWRTSSGEALEVRLRT